MHNKATFNYLPSLGMPEVDSALDWSWLVDIGQGNFDAARIAAQKALTSEKNSQTLFARALVHQLQGEYESALILFEAAFAASDEVEQKSIIAVMIHLSELKAGELFPDHFSLNFEAIKLNSPWRKQYRLLKEKVGNPYVQLEGSLIGDVATVLPNFRSVLSKLYFHQSRDRADGESIPPAQTNEYLDEIKEQLTKQLEIYQGLDIFIAVHLIYSAMAELFGLAGASEQGLEILEQLIQACLKSQNQKEAAWYLLSKADLLTTSLVGGKPICFGYCLTNFVANLNSSSQLDEDLDLSAIHELYYQARKYFANSGALRGEATAIMRLAYLNTLEGQWYLANQGYEEARERFVRLGDRLNAMAAEMGKLWTSAYYDRPEGSAIAMAEKLARKARDNGALAWGISWGLAFARAAGDALCVNKNLEAALWCTSLAETIFAVFSQPVQFAKDSILETYYRFLQAQILQRAFGLEGAMQQLYAKLALALVDGNNWAEAFTIGEMIRACLLPNFSKRVETTSQSVRESDKTIFLEEIANYLPSQTLLVSYLLLDRSILVWGVNSTGLVAKINLQQYRGKEFLASNFLEDAKQLMEKISQGTSDDRLGLCLETILLEPLGDRCDRSHHVIFVPPAELLFFPFHTLSWRGQPLGLQKSISYLPTTSQLQQISSTQTGSKHILVINGIEGILTNTTSSDRFKQLTYSSLVRANAKLLAQFSEVEFLNAAQIEKSAVLDALSRSPKITHLYVQPDRSLSSGILLAGGEIISTEELANLNLNVELMILSVFSQNHEPLTTNELLDLVQSLIHAGVKTIAVNLWHGDNLATAMLIYFLHQRIAAGASLGVALTQAQQQLSRVSIQQALDFCRDAQASLAWQNDPERADRAIITQHVGDLMAFGGNYTRAAEAYLVALNILKKVGYSERANALATKYKYMKSLTQNQMSFNPNLLIFNSPEYWGSFALFGNWH
jgi:CHAT domain-containing protein